MRLCSRPQRQGPDHELIWLVVSVASVVGGAAWLAIGLPWPQCPFFTMTGLPCVTCGATRTAIAFFNGNLPLALQWNPLAFFAFCAVIGFDLYAVIVLIGRLPRLRTVDWTAREKNVARIFVISLLALNWMYLLAHHQRFLHSTLNY
jgi:hypothetical protein